MWKPNDASTVILLVPIKTVANPVLAVSSPWQEGVLPVHLPSNAERKDAWSDKVLNEDTRLTIVAPGPGSVVYPTKKRDASPARQPSSFEGVRWHLLLDQGILFESLRVDAMEIVSLPSAGVLGIDNSSEAILALHMQPVNLDGAPASITQILKSLHLLCEWIPSNEMVADQRVRNAKKFFENIKSKVPGYWCTPSTRSRLLVCTLFMSRDILETGFDTKNIMYFANSGREIRDGADMQKLRKSLQVIHRSSTWCMLIMRDGISLTVDSDSFTSSLQSYFHSIYLDAIILARLQVMRIQKFSDLMPLPELFERNLSQQLELSMLDFRCRHWWGYFTIKTTSHSDVILSQCQSEFKVSERMKELDSDISDASRIATLLASQLQIETQEKSNYLIAFIGGVFAPLGISYAAFAVLMIPSVQSFIFASALGIFGAIVTGFAFRSAFRKRGSR